MNKISAGASAVFAGKVSGIKQSHINKDVAAIPIEQPQDIDKIAAVPTWMWPEKGDRKGFHWQYATTPVAAAAAVGGGVYGGRALGKYLSKAIPKKLGITRQQIKEIESYDDLRAAERMYQSEIDALFNKIKQRSR